MGCNVYQLRGGAGTAGHSRHVKKSFLGKHHVTRLHGNRKIKEIDLNTRSSQNVNTESLHPARIHNPPGAGAPSIQVYKTGRAAKKSRHQHI